MQRHVPNLERGIKSPGEHSRLRLRERYSYLQVGVTATGAIPEIFSSSFHPAGHANIATLTELYEQKNEDFLYEMIARYDPDSIHALPQDSAHLVNAGKKWFAKRNDEIRQFVCPKIPEDVNKPIADELVLVVFGYFSATHGKAFAAFATALVVKKIIQGWCRNYNHTDET